MDLKTRTDARTLAQFAALDHIPADVLFQATECGIHTVDTDEFPKVASMFAAIKQLAAKSGTPAPVIGRLINRELKARYATELQAMGIAV